MTSHSHLYQKRSVEIFFLLSTLASSASGFGGVALPATRSTTTKPSTALQALIYGWDGTEETTDTTASYSAFASDLGESCTPEGLAVAASLSVDGDRAGHLARLAVAFSPPERALTLSDIENVDVICVHYDRIDIQAALCEDAGCVSLSVPVKFPVSCYSNDPTNQLEGCVLRNLDELDSEAGAVLMVAEQQAAVEARMGELDDLCELNGAMESFPSWWIPPECYAHLVQDCETIRQLLNEDEFQPDVVALAQDALRRISGVEDYRVLQAKVAIVGPAGMCFKVRAANECAFGRSIRILEVVHPFDQATYDVESLRAAVLGAVAAAEGN